MNVEEWVSSCILTLCLRRRPWVWASCSGKPEPSRDGGKMFRTILAVLTFSALAGASTITFNTAAGAQDAAGAPVSASAAFTTGAGFVDITLTDKTAATPDAGALLSDLFFTLSFTPGALNTTTTPTSAPLIDIAANGSVTTNNGAIAAWGLTSNGATVHLDSLAGGATQTIIGPGPYAGVSNSSILDNNGHNPFINQTATFHIAISGVTADTTITGAAFSWGTLGGDNTTGVCTPGTGPNCGSTTVPEPITSSLVGAGLISLFFLRRRVRG